MLSRAELAYLQGIKQVEDNYRYCLTHSIKQKIKTLEEKDIPALLQNPATRETLLRLLTKTLREFPKTSEREEDEVEGVSLEALRPSDV